MPLVALGAIALAFVLGYTLARGPRPTRVLLAAGASAVAAASGYVAGVVLHAAIGPRLMSDDAAIDLFRRGSISYNELESLRRTGTEAMIAAMVVAIAMAAVFALVMRRLTRPRDAAPATAAVPVQVAGFPCVSCGKSIISIMEATPCERCGRPIHYACQAAHACGE